MFRNRRRSQSNPVRLAKHSAEIGNYTEVRRAQLNKSPPTSAAATAAAQAFLSNRASNANLSSAAAAAALRSHTTSPIPVSQVQTKRTVQRHGSASSNGSAAGPGRLKRQGSSGSMTERTFREQSPSRPTSRDKDEEPPPMPALPKAYASNTSKSIRRPASAEPPERISSPPPKLPGGRGLSLDRGPGTSIVQSKKPPGTRKPNLSNIVEQDRGGNRGSVNFSRPMSPSSSPPTSPITEREPDKRSIPNSRVVSGPSSLPAGESQNLQYSVRETANAPVKKKKKKVVSSITEGSHLNAGGLGGKPAGSEVEGSRRPQESFTQALSPTPAVPQATARRKTRAATPPDNSTHVRSYSSDSESSEQSYSSDRPTKIYNTRAAGMLTKQPSIVREDLEGEETEEQNTIPPTRKPNSTHNGFVQNGSTPNGTVQNGAAKPHTIDQDASSLIPTGTPAAKDFNLTESRTDSKNEHSNLQPLATTNLQQESNRSSLSPVRSAHFSSRPTYETPSTIRHQPPARSVSPAKSALKQSPSPRGPSPAELYDSRYRPGQAPSEASDSLSVVSDEGNKSMTRRKKSVRVSFDDDPTIVGEAAQPASTAGSPIIMSPQNRLRSGKSWFSLGRDKKKGGQIPEDSDDDVIQPIPVLPSFGSIRERKGDQDMSESIPKASENQSSASSSAQTLQDMTSSNDHALGGIIAQDLASHGQVLSSSTANEPLPPEVTSVEGSGYHSDTESSTGSVNIDLVRNSDSTPIEPVLGSDSVPIIAVQPATPGIEGPEANRDSWLYMPGGFPSSSEALSRDVNIPVPESDPVVPDSTPSAAGIAEPEPEVSAAYHEPGSPVVGQVAESISQQTNMQDKYDDDSDDSGNSIYSDAAEDAMDFEGDGFGSINAIVDSPVVAPVEPSRTISPVDKEISIGDGQEEKSNQGWEGAQAFWSAVNGSRKAGPKESDPKLVPQVASTIPLEKRDESQEPISETTNKVPEPQTSKFEEPRALTTAPKPKQKQKQKQKPKTTEDLQPMRKSMREPAPPPQDPPKKSPLRSSMRDGARQTPMSQNPEPHRLAPSMRNGPTKESRNKQRGLSQSQIIESLEPKGTLQKRQRPASTGGMIHTKSPSASGASHPPLPDKQPTMKPPSSSRQPALPMSSLRRTTSNGSDSSSSFRKARRPSSNSGRYTMKRSMRSDAAQSRPQSEVIPPSNFSVRSASPSMGMGRRPMSSSGFGMRTSMRDPKTTMRSSSPPTSSSFGKGPKAKTTKTAKPVRRFASRFGDSSDEDEGPKKFSSRFGDSSDEDEPSALKLTPIRGIPKRIDEGDSTDLEDSDDETKKGVKPKSILKPRAIHEEGSALASGSLRQNGAENGNGNAGSVAPVLGGRAEKEKKKSFFGTLGRRKDKSKILKVDVESAARRDTPLERTKLERSLFTQPVGETPNGTPNETLAQSPRSPKLQRRNTPQKMASDSWPLPESPSIKTDGRPMTSDGAPRTMRPPIGNRQISTATVDSTGAVIGKSGKKKRFPMLRKAFGLHD